MEGLQRISGERIWMELKKILAGKYSKELVLRMVNLGLASYIGLPSECDTTEFSQVCKRIDQLGLIVNPITRLTALLRTDKEVGKYLIIKFQFKEMLIVLCRLITNRPQL